MDDLASCGFSSWYSGPFCPFASGHCEFVSSVHGDLKNGMIKILKASGVRFSWF